MIHKRQTATLSALQARMGELDFLRAIYNQLDARFTLDPCPRELHDLLRSLDHYIFERVRKQNKVNP
jgi:hypothetical protein